MTAENKLRSLVLAPYIVKATALIGNAGYVGGNQFRHAFATLGILLDYKYFSNPVLLKPDFLIHQLFLRLLNFNQTLFDISIIRP